VWKCLRGVLSLLGPTTLFQTPDFTPCVRNNLLTAMIPLVFGTQSNLMQSHPIGLLAPCGIWSLEGRRQSMSLPDGTERGSFSPPTGYESRVVVTSCLEYRYFKGSFSRSLRPCGLLTLDLEIPEQPLSNLILRYGRIPGPLLLSDLRPAGPSGLPANLDSVCRPLLDTSNVTDRLRTTPSVSWWSLRSRAGKDTIEASRGQHLFSTFFAAAGWFATRESYHGAVD
jgi:hypothetical protein